MKSVIGYIYSLLFLLVIIFLATSYSYEDIETVIANTSHFTNSSEITTSENSVDGIKTETSDRSHDLIKKRKKIMCLPHGWCMSD